MYLSIYYVEDACGESPAASLDRVFSLRLRFILRTLFGHYANRSIQERHYGFLERFLGLLGGVGGIWEGLGGLLESSCLPLLPRRTRNKLAGITFHFHFRSFFAFSKSSETTTGVGPERFSAARAPRLVRAKAPKTASSDPWRPKTMSRPPKTAPRGSRDRPRPP